MKFKHDIRVNVICNWFADGEMRHMFSVGKSSVPISLNKGWDGDTYKYVGETSGRVVELFFNQDDPGFDYVVDVGSSIMSKASFAYPEYRRILALSEPIFWMNPDAEKEDEPPQDWLDDQYVNQISIYYPRLILGWQAGIRDLEQCHYWNATNKWTSIEYSRAEKQFGLSGFISSKYKKGVAGYEMRRRILAKQGAIQVPGTVYNYAGRWRGTKVPFPVASKDAGMVYMFSLAIESTKDAGNFTEKLIDCFATRSVPIYFGAPDIGSFFNADGIITLDESNWIDQINGLRELDYTLRAEAIEENFEKSKEYWLAMRSLAKAMDRELG